MQQVDVGDLSFDVRTDGPEDGPPVLLLHGFPETSLSWSAVTPLLAEAGRRVLLVDFDPQGALSVGLGVNPLALELTVYDLLMDKGVGVDDVLLETEVDGLHRSKPSYSTFMSSRVAIETPELPTLP